MIEVPLKMSKKVMNILNKHAPSLLTKRRFLQSQFSNQYVVDNEMNAEYSKVTELIFHQSISDLNKIETALKTEYSETNLSIARQMQSGKPDPDLLEQQELYKVQLDVIENTIRSKREYHKKFTHPVERNTILHGVFNTSLPVEGSDNYNRIRNSEGIIEFHKKGFRKLFYKNDHGGNLLTGFDAKVFISVLRLWHDKGKGQKLKFSFKELLDAMQMDYNSGEYPAITKSLRNLAGTQIIMEEYFDPNRKSFSKTRIHTPFQDAEIDAVNCTAEFELSNYIHDSLMAGHYVTINMALFNDLANDASRTLYINIISQLPENVRMVAIDELIEQMGLQSSTRTKAFNIIQKAFDELVDFNVLESYQVLKSGRFYNSICFTPTSLQHLQHLESTPLLSI